jgi:hypothetical protein
VNIRRNFELVGIQAFRLHKGKFGAENLSPATEYDQNADIRDFPRSPESAASQKVRVEINHPV